MPDADLSTLAVLLGLVAAHRVVLSLLGWSPGRLTRLAWAHFVARCLLALAYLLIIEIQYDGRGDAIHYHMAGANYSRLWWEGGWSFFNAEPLGPGSLGTDAVRRIAVAVEIVIGTNLLALGLVFGFLAHCGVLLICSSFGPNPERQADFLRRLLMVPSALFWTSTVGKDALTLLAIGFSIRSCTEARIGRLLLFGLGFLLAAAVRPHLGVAISFAISSAHILAEHSPAKRIALAVAGSVLVYALAGSALERMSVDIDDMDSITASIDQRAASTFRGGSKAIAQESGMAARLVAIVCRPLPWESTNGLMLLCSLELLGLWLWGVSRVRSQPKMLHDPSVQLIACALIALALTLMTAVAVGNFGILARQRAPILVMAILVLEFGPRESTCSRSRVPALPMAATVSQTYPSDPDGAGAPNDRK
nr:hypothetical protein [Nitrosomonas nitrosa]